MTRNESVYSSRASVGFLFDCDRIGPMKLALSVVFLLSATTTLCGQKHARGPSMPVRRRSFNVVEATIPEMQAAMAEGRVTSRELVTQYLLRIALYNSKLNAVISVNPNALSDADARDRDRAVGKVRGPLHGIPIALKDNMLTIEMPTTGGALAFASLIPPYEATLTKNLRDAGAIIIAKTTMTELANWVAGGPTPMPAGYNGLIGYSMNPYDPRRDPRADTFDGRPVLATGGSSSARF
jgi:amidase